MGILGDFFRVAVAACPESVYGSEMSKDARGLIIWDCLSVTIWEGKRVEQLQEEASSVGFMVTFKRRDKLRKGVKISEGDVRKRVSFNPEGWGPVI